MVAALTPQARAKAEFVLSQVQAVQDSSASAKKAVDLPHLSSVLDKDKTTLADDDLSLVSNAHDADADTDEPTKEDAELLRQNKMLQQTVTSCHEALADVNQNADLKLRKLELEVTYLRRALQDATTINQRLKICVETKELQHIAAKTADTMDPTQRLRLRDRAVEKHLTSMLTARNQATKENYHLKRLLLKTCMPCRQQVNRAVRKASASSSGTALSSTIDGGTEKSDLDVGSCHSLNQASTHITGSYLPPPSPMTSYYQVAPSPGTPVSVSPRKKGGILKNCMAPPVSLAFPAEDANILPLTPTQSTKSFFKTGTAASPTKLPRTPMHQKIALATSPVKKAAAATNQSTRVKLNLPASPTKKTTVQARSAVKHQPTTPMRASPMNMNRTVAPGEQQQRRVAPPAIPQSPATPVKRAAAQKSPVKRTLPKAPTLRPMIQVRSESSSSIVDSVPDDTAKTKSGDSVTMVSDASSISADLDDSRYTVGRKKGWWRKNPSVFRGKRTGGLAEV